LLFVGFLEIRLETVYPTMGIDGKRYEKIAKDRNRCKKMGKDARRWESTAALLKNAGFQRSLDEAVEPDDCNSCS